MGTIFASLVPENDTTNTALMAPVHALLGRLGLGRKTGLPLPFESAGQVTPLKDWSRNYTLVSVSFGYELGATVLQMGAVVATLADGYYRPPRLVHSLRTAEGWQDRQPAAPSPVFAPATAATVRNWMVKVVEQGSGKAALQAGVPVAGKTGTSFKEADRRKENHSFVALVPANAPRLALVVMLDDPQNGRYSSQTTVPAAGRILRKTLAYLGDPP
jgi:cell division protein FtsI (penicillin-binding protein 3)